MKQEIDGVSICLRGNSLTFPAVADLQELVLAHLTGVTVLLDLSKVTNAQTDGMVALVELRKKLLAQQGNLLICNPSDVVRHFHNIHRLQFVLPMMEQGQSKKEIVEWDAA